MNNKILLSLCMLILLNNYSILASSESIQPKCYQSIKCNSNLCREGVEDCEQRCKAHNEILDCLNNSTDWTNTFKCFEKFKGSLNSSISNHKNLNLFYSIITLFFLNLIL